MSIIIPCYNSEATLEETLLSIQDQHYTQWEAIIVDDGSIDNSARIAEKWVQKDSRFNYFWKENGGLGSARNFGIQRSIGKYILPLDSDNLIEPFFASEALNILKDYERVGVVHGHAEFFGEKTGKWIIDEYNFERLLALNYIDACAIFRKSLWVKVGGYDEKIPYQGIEDWDLWLAFGVQGVQFHHLNKVTFRYRIASNSMIRSYTKEIFDSNVEYLTKKYSKEYYSAYYTTYCQLKKYQKRSDENWFFMLKRKTQHVFLNISKIKLHR